MHQGMDENQYRPDHWNEWIPRDWVGWVKLIKLLPTQIHITPETAQPITMGHKHTTQEKIMKEYFFKIHIEG